MKNRLKEILESGRPAIGSWIGFVDPFAVEVMAEAGFDWLLIDTEHFPIGREALRTILVALKGSRTVPVVRIPKNSPEYFQTALDLGAQGIVVPMVSSREDVRRAIASCRYPPLGNRGSGPVRASRYFHDLRDYVRNANSEIALIVQIETPAAVDSIQEILNSEGIDGVFIGPADLASFMNRATESNDPDVECAIGRIIACARACAVPFGLPTWTPEECMEYARRGARLLTLGGDLHFLSGSAQKAVSGVRCLMEKLESSGSE